MGSCSCCQKCVDIEELPDWQIAGYNAYNWSQRGECCWSRLYVAIGNYNTRVQTTDDLIRSALVSFTRVDAIGYSAVERLGSEALTLKASPFWPCPNGLDLPPIELCPIPIGSVADATLDCNIEEKIRGVFYYQPNIIEITLSFDEKFCEENPKPSIYTLSVRTFFRGHLTSQRFGRNCTKRRYYVSHKCLELKPNTGFDFGQNAGDTPDCSDTTNIDYPNPLPPEEFIWTDFDTFNTYSSSVTVYQFEEIPKSITVNSHESQITEEYFNECILSKQNCHFFPPRTDVCVVFDSRFTEFSFIFDRTFYYRIVTENFSYFNPFLLLPLTTPPNLVFRQTIFCPGTIPPAGLDSQPFSANYPYFGNPTCTLSFNKIEPLPSPPSPASGLSCTIPSGRTALLAAGTAYFWYRFKPAPCVLEPGLQCPSDGNLSQVPDGYECGWYGGRRVLTIPVHNLTIHEQETEYLPPTERTVCIDPFDFILEAPNEQD
jgi:hypothetical protein